MNNPSPLMKKYMSVPEWVKTYGYFPLGGIRHLIFTNTDFNKKVVKKIGKKILLDVEAFDKWIHEHKG